MSHRPRKAQTVQPTSEQARFITAANAFTPEQADVLDRFSAKVTMAMVELLIEWPFQNQSMEGLPGRLSGTPAERPPPTPSPG